MSHFDYEKAKRKDSAKIYRVGRNVGKIPRKIPPTESQLRLIAELKKKLSDYGKEIPDLGEAEDKRIARTMIDTLLKFCKENNL